MPTILDDLTASLPDDLVPTGALPSPPASVTGVHISELLDPTPFLTGGELLLTTGLTLTTHVTRLADYVTRLRGAGVVALGFGVGPVHTSLPPQLVDACARVGLPLLVVPRRARFQTVVAAFWQREREAERTDLRGALGSTHALVRAATSGPSDRSRTRARVVRALATGVGGWAAHIDDTGRAGVVWPVTARPAARRAGAEVHRLRTAGPVAGATFPLDDDDVLLQPVGSGDGGYLACGCARPTPQRMRHLVLAACAVLELHGTRLAESTALREAMPAVLGRLLLLGHVDAARDVALSQSVVWPPAVRVVVAEIPGALGSGLGPARAGQPRPADRGPVRRIQSRSDEGATAALLSWAATCGALARHREGSRVTVITAADHVPVPPPESARAVSSAPTPPGTVSQVYARLLTRLSELSAGDWAQEGGARGDRSGAVLQALHGHPRGDLIATLAAYLRHRGRPEEVAAELGVHRNTVRHRLTLIRELTGDDPDDPDLAARLWLALRESGQA